MQQRFDDVCAAAAALLVRGALVYSPIAHGHAIATGRDLPQDLQFWMRHCFGMLDIADELQVLMLDGWEESRGVKAEIARWKALRNRAVKYLDPAGALV
jgi:hypothetical protein